MKNVIPKMTGFEYFKKWTDLVLKKNSFNKSNETLRHFKVLILLNYNTCATATYIMSKQPLSILSMIFITNCTLNFKLYKKLSANHEFSEKDCN